MNYNTKPKPSMLDPVNSKSCALRPKPSTQKSSTVGALKIRIEFWVLGFGFWVLGLGFRVTIRTCSDPYSRLPFCSDPARPRGSQQWRKPNLGASWAKGLGFRVWGLGLRKGLGFRV